MSALIRLNGAMAARYVGIELNGSSSQVQIAGHGVGLGGGHIESLTGSDKEVQQGVLMPNTTVKLSFGEMAPSRYEVLVTINPELTKVAMVSAPSILPPGKHEISITLKPFKKLELNSLPWIVAVYLID